jgi:hypothetical protein
MFLYENTAAVRTKLLCQSNDAIVCPSNVLTKLETYYTWTTGARKRSLWLKDVATGVSAAFADDEQVKLTIPSDYSVPSVSGVDYQGKAIMARLDRGLKGLPRACYKKASGQTRVIDDDSTYCDYSDGEETINDISPPEGTILETLTGDRKYVIKPNKFRRLMRGLAKERCETPDLAIDETAMDAAIDAVSNRPVPTCDLGPSPTGLQVKVIAGEPIEAMISSDGNLGVEATLSRGP